MILGEIYISPLSSLTFDKIIHPFDGCVSYCQKFVNGDTDMKLRFTSNVNLEFYYQVSPVVKTNLGYFSFGQIQSSQNVDGLWVYSTSIGLPDEASYAPLGIYQFDLQVKIGTQQITFLRTYFELISQQEADDRTILLEATNVIDDYFVSFSEDEICKWRIEGGLLQSEFTSQLIQNSFRDQRIRSHQLSQKPYTTKILTIGDTLGVPIWAGEKLNHFLSLTDVFISYKGEDRVRIVRVDSEVPALTQISDYYPLYVFKCRVEEQIEPNIL